MNFKEREALVAGGPEYATRGMTYPELEERVLELRAQIKRLEGEANEATVDLFARRRELIRTGKPLPDDMPLRGLPNWDVQRRREQVAAENVEVDQAVRRAPHTAQRFA